MERHGRGGDDDSSDNMDGNCLSYWLQLWEAEWERDGNTDVLYLCGLISVCHRDDNTYPLPAAAASVFIRQWR